MTKKLIKHGNSAALILDKAILELLNVTMDTPLEISTDGKSIVISPSSPHSEDQLQASLSRINDRFSETLSKLAK
jgi:antitoxin component of MazEF toxin-antitoxin module